VSYVVEPRNSEKGQKEGCPTNRGVGGDKREGFDREETQGRVTEDIGMPGFGHGGRR
jgi:hypothetical protein